MSEDQISLGAIAARVEGHDLNGWEIVRSGPTRLLDASGRERGLLLADDEEGDEEGLCGGVPACPYCNALVIAATLLISTSPYEADRMACG